MQTDPKRYQCRHIFTDGRRCGSPSLRREEFCYYHHTTRRPAPRASSISTDDGGRSFHIPQPEDRSAIQQSIGEVLSRIASNTIDLRAAGLLLYGLQIASLNLPRPTPTRESTATGEIVEEISTHPTHGILAPEAEVAAKPLSFAAQLIAHLNRSQEPEPETETTPESQSEILPEIQATADPSLIPQRLRRQHLCRRPARIQRSNQAHSQTHRPHDQRIHHPRRKRQIVDRIHRRIQMDEPVVPTHPAQPISR